MSLSDKEMEYSDICDCPAYRREDIKQAVQELKEAMEIHKDTLITGRSVNKIIDKIFGDKLK